MKLRRYQREAVAAFYASKPPYTSEELAKAGQEYRDRLMKEVGYTRDESGQTWWCNSHERKATHLRDGLRVCDPQLGGILLPCRCVQLDGIAEIIPWAETAGI